jgi:hypothetical protein
MSNPGQQASAVVCEKARGQFRNTTGALRFHNPLGLSCVPIAVVNGVTMDRLGTGAKIECRRPVGRVVLWNIGW